MWVKRLEALIGTKLPKKLSNTASTLYLWRDVHWHKALLNELSNEFKSTCIDFENIRDLSAYSQSLSKFKPHNLKIRK